MPIQGLHDIPHEALTQLQHELHQQLGGRTLVRARLILELDGSVADTDVRVPLGTTTDETIQHIGALVLEPGLRLARELIQGWFARRAYRLGELEDET